MNIWETHDLTKHFTVRRGFLKQNSQLVRALEGVSLSQAEGETLGLVGESGCGKSTFGRTLMGLYPITSGRIVVARRSRTCIAAYSNGVPGSLCVLESAYDGAAKPLGTVNGADYRSCVAQ